MKTIYSIVAAVVAVPLLLGSCASKKAVADGNTSLSGSQPGVSGQSGVQNSTSAVATSP